MSKDTKYLELTQGIRITKNNAKRLTSLAGELQMKSGKKKTLDDAIDCLFDCREQLELVKKKEKPNES